MRDAFADLALFRAVVEAGGFRAAARPTRASPSALSAAVRRLEERIGVRLLNRTTRSIAPTDAGRRLLDGLTPAFAEIDAALRDVQEAAAAPRGTLRLNVPTVVADLVLPAILPGFLARHPQIVVEVKAEDRFVDVLAGGFDAGVRYGERLDQDMIAVPIGPRTQRYVTAAAPGLLETLGQITHPKDLMAAPALRYRFASGALAEWEFDAPDGSTLRLAPPSRLVAERMTPLLAAAEAGVGIIQTFDGYLEPLIARGALVEILQDWSQPFPGPQLYYAGRRLTPPCLRAFLDDLKGR